MDARANQLKAWLIQYCHHAHLELVPMQGDASFRRYFRVHMNDTTFVAMDAPPSRENCLPFVAIAEGLRAINLITPQIIKKDFESGFLLLSDLGDKLLLKELELENVNNLYNLAIDALLQLKECQHIEGWRLPVITAEFFRQELQLFQDWFLQKHLNLAISPQVEKQLALCFDFLCYEAIKQPQVFVHRDYHSANLMVLPNNKIGILDFQDAFHGPLTYDLVSLLRDCYITWPDNLVTELALRYWEKMGMSNVSADQFMRWFDLMGLQRHMKALLTFARKFHRDNNANYLSHIPRTLDYLVNISARYPQCRILHSFIINEVVGCVP